MPILLQLSQKEIHRLTRGRQKGREVSDRTIRGHLLFPWTNTGGNKKTGGVKYILFDKIHIAKKEIFSDETDSGENDGKAFS